MSVSTKDLLKIVKDVNDANKAKLMGLVSEHGMASDVKRFISTGATVLDFLFRGGVPVGRIIEIFGQPGAGKSTLAAHIMANCQSQGGLAVLIDAESKFFKIRAQNIGVNMEKVLTLKPRSLEDAFSLIRDVSDNLRKKVDKDIPIVVIWDTIAQTPAESEIEQKGGMSNRSRVIRSGLRLIADKISDQQIAMVIINQIMIDITKMYAMETSPGGKGLFHATTLRFKMNRSAAKESGSIADITVDKNNVDGPLTNYNKATIPIYADSGIDDIESMLIFLLDEGKQAYGKTKEPKKSKTQRPEIYADRAWIRLNVNGHKYSCQRSKLCDFIVDKGLDSWLRGVTAKYFLSASPLGYTAWVKSQEENPSPKFMIVSDLTEDQLNAEEPDDLPDVSSVSELEEEE